MKQGRYTVILALLMLVFGQLSAQLYVGPALQGGMTYSKNFIIDDTSQYYIANSPSAFAAAGLDFAYQFDDNIRLQVGAQGQYRAFNLVAPDGVTGLSFTNIKKSTVVIAVPVTINYRVPLKEGSNKYLNFVAGHSLDFTFADSTRINTPSTMVDSGNGFARHDLQITKGFPISSVLLGAGLDMKTENGLLNVSLMWGISTRALFTGNAREWEVLNQSFDPALDTDPEEFPEHYYDWSLRGSNLSLRVSYYFQLTGKAEKAEKSDKMSNEKPEKEEKVKKEKPEKEKKAKKEKASDDE